MREINICLLLCTWNASDLVKLYTGLYAQELEEQMSQIEELQKEEQLLLPENINYLRCLFISLTKFILILYMHDHFPYTLKVDIDIDHVSIYWLTNLLCFIQFNWLLYICYDGNHIPWYMDFKHPFNNFTDSAFHIS